MISTMLSRAGSRQLDQLRAQQLRDQLDKLHALQQSAERMIAATMDELHEVHERLLAGS